MWAYFLYLFIYCLHKGGFLRGQESFRSCKISIPPLRTTWVFISCGPRALSSDEKRPKNKLTTQFSIVPNLRMSGAIPQFLHGPLRHGEGLWFSPELRIFLFTTSSVAESYGFSSLPLRLLKRVTDFPLYHFVCSRELRIFLFNTSSLEDSYGFSSLPLRL